MKFFDRVLTIVVTATLVSAIWIVFGSAFLEEAAGGQEGDAEANAAPEEAAPAPAGAPEVEAGASQATPTSGPAAAAAATATAAAPRAGTLLIPVEGVSASALEDSFLQPRGENDTRLHEAIDIMAPVGTPVLAAAPGRIAKLHNSRAGGRSIYVRSSDGLRIYVYAHLKAYASNLDEGDRVAAGDLLGSVGTSGNAEARAPHLHFQVLETTADAEWWEPANPINPYPLLTEGG